MVQLWEARPTPTVTAPPGSMHGMLVKEFGDAVTQVQGLDQRHTLDLQVPSSIPWPPATGAASGSFRAGDTVHLERGTQVSPWVKGGDWGLIGRS